jgi:hypothetical protein
MQNEDWIKFGHTIWDQHTGKKKAYILKMYKKAWTEIYNTAPDLENGGPADFLNDTKYTCDEPVPWGQHHEARFSSSMKPTEPLEPTPEPQPSTSTLTSPAAQAPASKNISDGMNAKMKKAMGEIEFEAIYETEFPRIKLGLLDGFIPYLQPTTPKDKLGAIFTIIPQYVPNNKNNQATCDVSAVVVDEEDAAVLLKVEPNCMYLAADQTKCGVGKARYFCNSWVCV